MSLEVDKATTFLLYGSHFVQGRIELSGLALVVKAVYIASVAGLVESLQRFTMGTLVSFLFLVFSLSLKCLFLAVVF